MNVRIEQMGEDDFKGLPQPVFERVIQLKDELDQKEAKVWVAHAGKIEPDQKSITLVFCPFGHSFPVGGLTIQEDGIVTDKHGIGANYLKSPPKPIEGSADEMPDS